MSSYPVSSNFWEISLINCYFLHSSLKLSFLITCFLSLAKDLCSRAAVQEDEALKMTCYLTSGALMHEYCKKKDHTCLTDKATVILLTSIRLAF